jgi:hypothetical protein
LWVELPSPEKIEEYPILQKESYLSDHKDPLSQDLFLLFEIEHPLQRFDSRLIGIDNPPLETYQRFSPHTAQERMIPISSCMYRYMYRYRNRMCIYYNEYLIRIEMTYIDHWILYIYVV